jgi:lysophospholipase L1-like esterase
MMEKERSPRQSWFEKNPKKTLLLVLFILLITVTFAAEKILAYINFSNKLVLFLDKRYINLRECQPNIDVMEVPTDKMMRESEGVVQKGYRIRTDANGFILPYQRYDRPDLTLVFLGGSTTACIFVEEENRFPYLVGHILEKDTGKKITAINGGVNGNNSLHSIDNLLNKVIPLKPDLVVMMQNMNDLIVLIYNQTYWNHNPSRAPIVEFSFYKNMKGLRALSTLARDIYIPNLHVATRILSHQILGKGRDPDDEFAQARGKPRELHPAEMIAEFKMNLQTFINICRARKITPVLMTQFNRLKPKLDDKIRYSMREFVSDTGLPISEFKDLFDKFTEAIREVGRDNQVMVIDLAREIPQEKEYMFDILHLNSAGSRLAASIISEKLRPVVEKQAAGVRF